MLGIGDLTRFLAPIKRKIFLLVGRSILAAINDEESTQKLQLKLLSDEIATDAEHFENYGFSAYPWEDAEALATFINGNRDHGIVVVVHDRRYRPDYLTQGEAVVFTDEDKTEAFRVHLKRGRILNLKCTDLDEDVTNNRTLDVGKDDTITITEDKTETIGGSKSETITGVRLITAASETKTLDTAFTVIVNTNAMIDSDGTNLLLGDDAIGSLYRLVDERFVSLFNDHVHDGVQGGAGSTNNPTTTMTTGAHCTDTVRGK